MKNKGTRDDEREFVQRPFRSPPTRRNKSFSDRKLICRGRRTTQRQSTRFSRVYSHSHCHSVTLNFPCAEKHFRHDSRLLAVANAELREPRSFTRRFDPRRILDDMPRIASDPGQVALHFQSTRSQQSLSGNTDGGSDED